MISTAIWAADAVACEALANRLGSAPGISVTGVAEREAAFVRLLEASPVDVAVIQMAGSIVSVPGWLAHETAVVAIVADGTGMLDVLRSGALAALPHSAGSAELVAAVQAAAAGLLALPAERLDDLLSADRLISAEAIAALEAWTLTPRETEVLALMAKGASNKAIARRLGITAHTAKFHVSSIFGKLRAASRAEAVAIAARLGLVML